MYSVQQQYTGTNSMYEVWLPQYYATLPTSKQAEGIGGMYTVAYHILRMTETEEPDARANLVHMVVYSVPVCGGTAVPRQQVADAAGGDTTGR